MSLVNVPSRMVPGFLPFKILKRGEEDKTTKVLNDCVPQIPIEKKKDGKDGRGNKKKKTCSYLNKQET